VPEEKCYIVAKAIFAVWIVFHLLFMASFNPPINFIRAELLNYSQTQDEVSDKISTEEEVGEKDAEFSRKTIAVRMKQFGTVRFYLLLAQCCVNFVLVLTTFIYLFWISWDALIRRSIYVILYCSIGVHIMSVPMLAALAYNPAAKIMPSADSSSLPTTPTPRLTPTPNVRNQVEILSKYLVSESDVVNESECLSVHEKKAPFESQMPPMHEVEEHESELTA